MLAVSNSLLFFVFMSLEGRHESRQHQASEDRFALHNEIDLSQWTSNVPSAFVIFPQL